MNKSDFLSRPYLTSTRDKDAVNEVSLLVFIVLMKFLLIRVTRAGAFRNQSRVKSALSSGLSLNVFSSGGGNATKISPAGDGCNSFFRRFKNESKKELLAQK
ncbi:MAG: hypothetical protein U5K69_22365 [Balneolaceae bacterium]|nr:hypothetical protein [Balneolaceae bacterium]